MEINKRSVGTFYENLAARYLENQNVMILERNYRNKRGEIDLIGLDPDGWLIFVEVKYRSSEYSGNPLAAMDHLQGSCRIFNDSLQKSGCKMQV